MTGKILRVPNVKVEALRENFVDGIVVDIKTVTRYLESYVDGIFVPTQFIAAGVSLGGHAIWSLLAEEPRIATAIIIIGSPNLTDMLLERLRQHTNSDSQGTREWPRSIEKLYQARDERVGQITGKKILILNGAVDNLVPSKFTRPWVEKYATKNDVAFLEIEENGHWLSSNMVDTISDWIRHLLV